MNNLEIATIKMSISHSPNPLLEGSLKAYQSDKRSQYFMNSRIVPKIEIKENAQTISPRLRVFEDNKEKIIYTLNKQAEVLVKATVKNNYHEIDMDISETLKDKVLMYEYIATGLYFFEIAIKEGFLPLHASAIAYKDEAICFSGPSGIGKSTQANLWLKNIENINLINDDKPLISCQDKPIIYGTPWSGKQFLNHNVHYPLKAIFFLEQGLSDQICDLSSLEKTVHLLRNTHRSEYEESNDQTLKNIEMLIKLIPIQKFVCTPTINSVKVLKNHLDGE